MSEIMVISRDNLFGNGRHFTGFQLCNKGNPEADYLARILDFSQWLDRNIAESDPSYKQPIAYAALLSRDGRIFAYQRSKIDAAYPEKRLQGKWSWGLGGHIKRVDIGSLVDPVIASLRRELLEEVEPFDPSHSSLLGYINLEHGVHEVHFGILYIVESGLDILNPRDPEIAEGKFSSIEECKAMLDFPDVQVEEWSRIALKPIESFIIAAHN